MKKIDGEERRQKVEERRMMREKLEKEKGDQSHLSQIDWPTEEDLQKKTVSDAADRQTHRHTDGHCDLETESIHWTNAVKIWREKPVNGKQLHIPSILCSSCPTEFVCAF